MTLPETLEAILGDVEPGLAQEDVGEEAAAHADLAVDTPDRERDAFLGQRVVPGQDMLVDAVHQRAVEIEQKSGLRDIGHKKWGSGRDGKAPIRTRFSLTVTWYLDVSAGATLKANEAAGEKQRCITASCGSGHW